MSKSRRNSKGQFRRSFSKSVRPLLWLIAGVIFLGFIWTYSQKQELLDPCDGCRFNFSARAYESPTMNHGSEFVVEEPRYATVTAYSCIGITDNYHLMMNCPSVKYYGEPRTANGTAPIIDKTMACDKANMGKTFEIEGVGRRTCTDTGGAIKGAGRFDLYVSSINEAYRHGKQQIQYWEVE